jgi:type I restriction enzyme S subunit
MKSGYKQTEVGVIPEDWKMVTLSEISAFITKGATPTTYGFRWETEGVPFLRSECITASGLDLRYAQPISEAAHQMLRRSAITTGDLLVSITGYVGRVALVENLPRGNINQHIARVRVTDSEVDPGYVYHFLSQPYIRRYFESITTGQAYPQISLRQVRDAKVPLPPLPEQRAIAAALADVDAAVEGLERLIAKKRDLKQAAMQQLLTGQTRLR